MHWVNVLSGDFNGDGHTDIIGQVQETGQWWVSLSTATGFITTPWAAWDPSVSWSNVLVGDFSGDGKDDILYRNDAGYFYSWDMNGTTIGSEGLLQGAAQWADPSFIVVKPYWDLV